MCGLLMLAGWGGSGAARWRLLCGLLMLAGWGGSAVRGPVVHAAGPETGTGSKATASTSPGGTSAPAPGPAEDACKPVQTPSDLAVYRRSAERTCRGREVFGYVQCIEDDDGRVQPTTELALRRSPGGRLGPRDEALRIGMALCEGDRVLTWRKVTVTIQELARDREKVGEIGQTWQVQGFTDLTLSWSRSKVSRGTVSLTASPVFRARRIALGERGKGWLEQPPTAGASHSDVRLEVLDGCRGEALVTVAPGTAKAGDGGGEHYLEVSRRRRFLPGVIWERVRGGETKRFYEGGERTEVMGGVRAAEALAEAQRSAGTLESARGGREPSVEGGWFQAPASGEVVVEVTPADARLWVDGLEVTVRRGEAALPLGEGEHTLEAAAAGYEARTGVFEVKAGRSVRVPFALTRPVAPSRVEQGPGTTAMLQSTSGTMRLPGSQVDLDWVTIPAGSFEMGSNEGGYDEKPVHRVTLSSFRLAKTEVTVAQYKACVDAKAPGCTQPGTGDYCNWGRGGRENDPINCVDWHQAKAFAAWLGGRLPTEAEWEYAARGSEGRKYPWGDVPAPSCELAVMDEDGTLNSSDGCGRDRTWPVCSKQPGKTPEGLCDMAGNVWEWVEDCYASSYEGAREDGTVPDNCQSDNADRVVRGGSWSDDTVWLRAAYRFRFWPGYRNVFLGFRVVLGSVSAGPGSDVGR